jgi:hypothetical protein
MAEVYGDFAGGNVDIIKTTKERVLKLILALKYKCNY